MTLQPAFEIAFAAAALVLIARDMHRAWRDAQRRPVTLLAAVTIVVLILGTLGGRSGPNPWWLTVPAAVLAWEAVRGWRQTPRSRLWEAGMAAFAAALLLGAVGLGVGSPLFATVLVVTGAASGVIGFGLLWKSRRREPRPWRANDSAHYERRSPERPNRESSGRVS